MFDKQGSPFARLLGFLCLVSMFSAQLAAAGDPVNSPFDTAVAVWQMGDASDSSNKNSELKCEGDVSVGTDLTGAEREDSIQRGGDGKVAEFRGGYLNAGQGADGELNLSGKAMTMCLRLRFAGDPQDTALFSKHGGHSALVYNLFCTDLGSGLAFGFELGTDWKDAPLRLSIPLKTVNPVGWHDVIARFTGPKVELFVDGVLVDEDWPIGALRQGNPEPCLLGAQSVNGQAKSGFRGQIDHAALWNRALSDDEITFLSGGKERAATRDVEILGPQISSMQYWRPRDWNGSVGDCMPFFHDGRFHLFYLFDRRHHGSKWGLGAHQWAHSSTTDLVHWEHHPMAIPITDQAEGSICTGSVLFNDGVYYAHYAVRQLDGTQYLARATSSDGIHFEKVAPSPLATPQEGYDPMHYRDPLAFQDPDTKQFHLLVTARLTDGRDGCIAHLLSNDLNTWTLTDPFLIPGRVTDCPDYFEWNGWYYLFAEFVYWNSRSPFGPWQQPESNRLDVLYVPKTAAFTGNRRIYVSWLPDDGWAGNTVFRELVQNEDGTLGTKFVPEMIPRTEKPLPLPFTQVVCDPADASAQLPGGYNTNVLADLPANVRITLHVKPEAGATDYGLTVRGQEGLQQGCELRFRPTRQSVQFLPSPNADTPPTPDNEIRFVKDLDKDFALDLILKDDIVDVSIGNRRTIVTRHKSPGDRLFFFARGGRVTFTNIEVRPLIN